ncbi:hypothetical protein MAR_011128 [Mya arenaria]|uniref:Uncharacterized protein n=1 Tax=Mya arenaria TaxID=6604 RepID=A0ABY7FVX0_MYAAR|nr:hypothetical protein MAR_011128 [Mya arenaria]
MYGIKGFVSNFMKVVQLVDVFDSDILINDNLRHIQTFGIFEFKFSFSDKTSSLYLYLNDHKMYSLDLGDRNLKAGCCIQLKIRVVNAFQTDLDTLSGMDSYDKRSRPSVISLQSLQAAHKPGCVSRKPNLPSSPEREEPGTGNNPFFGRQESIPYADE